MDAKSVWRVELFREKTGLCGEGSSYVIAELENREWKELHEESFSHFLLLLRT